jgi:hypothetical protein
MAARIMNRYCFLFFGLDILKILYCPLIFIFSLNKFLRNISIALSELPHAKAVRLPDS